MEKFNNKQIFIIKALMKIGYARTSTLDQNLDLQLDALKNCGCEKSTNNKFLQLKTIDRNWKIVCKRCDL